MYKISTVYVETDINQSPNLWMSESFSLKNHSESDSKEYFIHFNVNYKRYDLSSPLQSQYIIAAINKLFTLLTCSIASDKIWNFTLWKAYMDYLVHLYWNTTQMSQSEHYSPVSVVKRNMEKSELNWAMLEHKTQYMWI